MSRTLTTLLTGAAIAAGATAYDANAQSPTSAPAIPSTQPARTQTYIPENLTTPTKSRVRSSQDVKIDESKSAVEINGDVYIRYENKFAEEDELGFMLRLPQDRDIAYNIQEDSITATVIPNKFYIPTRATDTDGRFYTSLDLEGRKNNFNFETTVMGDTEFFTPRAETTGDMLPFYMAHVNLEQEDNVLINQDGTRTIRAPRGIFTLEGISAEDYTTRVAAFEAAEAAEKAAEQNRLDREEAKRIREAKEAAPKPGKVKGLGHK